MKYQWWKSLGTACFVLLLPHSVHDLKPGAYSATTSTGVYAYGQTTSTGSVYFLAPDSGAFVIQSIETSGVPTSNDPPAPQPVKHKSWFSKMLQKIASWFRGK